MVLYIQIILIPPTLLIICRGIFNRNEEVMKKIKVVFLSLVTFALVLLVNSYSRVGAITVDQGYLNTGQTKSGYYGVYEAKYASNMGETKATWYSGGGGTVYIQMNGWTHWKSKSGGALQPGGNPTSVTAFGYSVQYHKYLGVPAY